MSEKNCTHCNGTGMRRDPLHQPETVDEMSAALRNQIGAINIGSRLRFQTPDGSVYSTMFVFKGAGIDDELIVLLEE